MSADWADEAASHVASDVGALSEERKRRKIDKDAPVMGDNGDINVPAVDLVSLIIPVRNCSIYLDEMLQSVIGEGDTFPCFIFLKRRRDSPSLRVLCIDNWSNFL